MTATVQAEEAQKPGLPTLRQRLTSIVQSAYFWYVMLAASGASILSAGVALQYGVGHGLIAFGVLSVAGSEVVRQGMRRA